MPPQLPARINVLRQLLLNTPAIFEHQLIIKSAPTQLQNRRPHMINWHRNFSQSSPLLKKKPNVAPETADPFDFSILEAGIATAVDRLKAELSKLGTGGRFNPGVLENLRVPLVKDSKTTERLGDLAQVLPKGGRSVMLLVGEKEHMKSIVSAIQGSKDLNLQPVPDPNNSSQLNISLPPPTKESRDLAVAAAKKAGEAASLGVKNARAAMQKRLRAMELSKAALPDDLRKAHKDMEKIVERGTADVKQTVEAARKAMEKS